MSYRNDQVAKELMKALSRSIQEEFPLQRYGLITITDIVVTVGCERATVFVSAMKHGRDLCKLLNKKSKQLKESIHSQVNLRKIPQLHFEYDISNERTDRLEELMNEGPELD